MYRKINNHPFIPKCRTKWADKFDETFTENTWQKIFKTCFKFKCDTSLTWFQYRILNRIIGVRKYLCPIEKDVDMTCRLCHTDIESIEHLFYDCVIAKKFGAPYFFGGKID